MGRLQKMMRHTTIALVLFGFILGCGPDPDEIVNAENKKLSDMAALESAKIEEALNRIRTESEQIAKGETIEVITTAADLQPDTTESASIPEPVAPPVIDGATPVSFPHHIQLGAFTTEASAAASASDWQKKGFANVVFFENQDATTAYRYVVRLTGYSGYRSTLAESERINREYSARSFPLEVRP